MKCLEIYLSSVLGSNFLLRQYLPEAISCSAEATILECI